MTNHDTPNAKPLIHKGTQEEIPRNRLGSPYVELDLSSDTAAQTIGAYYIDLRARHAHWMKEEAPWRAPWLRPGPTEVELRLLESLVEQDGKVNFWDASIDLLNSRGTISVSFEEGCQGFINHLNLDVQTEQ